MGSLLLSPASWCTQDSVCALQAFIYLVLCKFWHLYDGVHGDLLQEGLCHTHVCCTQPYPSPLHPEPLPLQPIADPYLLGGHSNTILSQSLWGLWVLVHTRFVFSSLNVSGRYGVFPKHDFAPPTLLMGLLLCPWMWGISSQLLQHPVTRAPALSSIHPYLPNYLPHSFRHFNLLICDHQTHLCPDFLEWSYDWRTLNVIKTWLPLMEILPLNCS